MSQLMTLGLFGFSLATMPHNTKSRSDSANIASQKRYGKGPAKQFIGPDDDTITIEGTLVPELTGGPECIETLRTMKNQGMAWPLMRGTGEFFGYWFIEKLDDKESQIFHHGVARKIDFTIGLTRYHDRDPAVLGDLAVSNPDA